MCREKGWWEKGSSAKKQMRDAAQTESHINQEKIFCRYFANYERDSSVSTWLICKKGHGKDRGAENTVRQENGNAKFGLKKKKFTCFASVMNMGEKTGSDNPVKSTKWGYNNSVKRDNAFALCSFEKKKKIKIKMHRFRRKVIMGKEAHLCIPR
ncbi:hypothetical protein POVCU2_0025970 [Plasmodium ovale curtisi]|uniref:Uncharacterized protein n=1 Tax=Plasmodium ovale curtisi TaxID=864141 RepID=A0A1A8VXH7_PLAOA|nr:hypothetical protein POVCU2_0025970 [Plasmodium ovale curtisi]SBS92624.1 hypothetical protein POVCU1_023700 [Plasmodium ovale curtisi]